MFNRTLKIGRAWVLAIALAFGAITTTVPRPAEANELVWIVVTFAFENAVDRLIPEVIWAAEWWYEEVTKDDYCEIFGWDWICDWEEGSSNSSGGGSGECWNLEYYDENGDPVWFSC
jgi:hypothetical protein